MSRDTEIKRKLRKKEKYGSLLRYLLPYISRSPYTTVVNCLVAPPLRSITAVTTSSQTQSTSLPRLIPELLLLSPSRLTSISTSHHQPPSPSPHLHHHHPQPTSPRQHLKAKIHPLRDASFAARPLFLGGQPVTGLNRIKRWPDRAAVGRNHVWTHLI